MLAAVTQCVRFNSLLFYLALTWSYVAHSEVYYVSGAGNDRNSGTSWEKSWKTIRYAARAVEPGDVVMVAEGEYPQVTVAKSGLPGMPITFKGAANGDRPKLLNGINIGSHSWIVVENFDMPPGQGSGVSIRGGHHNIVRNFDVENHWRGVNINNGNNNLIEHFSATGGREGVYVYNNSSNNIIRNCKVHHNGNEPKYTTGDRHGVAIGGAGVNYSNVVEECEIAHNGGTGHTPALIAMYAPETVFRNNYVHSNYGGGVMISIGSEYSLVESNRIHSNGIEAVNKGERGVRALAVVGTEYVTVKNNALVSNAVSGGSHWHAKSRAPAGVIDVRQGGPKRVMLDRNIVKGNTFKDNRGGDDVLIGD